MFSSHLNHNIIVEEIVAAEFDRSSIRLSICPVNSAFPSPQNLPDMLGISSIRQMVSSSKRVPLCISQI